MKIQQKQFPSSGEWKTVREDSGFDPLQCQLALVFSSKALLEDSSIFSRLREMYPQAHILMNSTAGEILDVSVQDDTLSLTAIQFARTEAKPASVNIRDFVNSYTAAKSLAGRFDLNGLVNVLVISDGQLVNGSDLVNGLLEVFPKEVIITGGLAGDGSRFHSTLVGLDEPPAEGVIAAVGFYGPLSVTYGSVGGWSPFGPERLITRSKDNILYELDGQPALDIYKNYLGDYAKDLPSSGLLFPLSIRSGNAEESVVRTILNINEEDRSVIFAGNMPEGNYARLMKSNYDRLIEGSSAAAHQSKKENSPELAILISCVGRKLVLDQRIEEEIEVVKAVYGDKTAITGFYSYGEISPSFKFAKCELHNQTMTITTFTEN